MKCQRSENMKINIEKTNGEDLTIGEIILIIISQILWYGFIGFVLWLLFNI